MTDYDTAENRPQPGDRLRFDGKSTSWLVRAQTADRRYSLATASLFGNIYYTIIDWQENVRGAMNVIGGGLGIFTASGDDPAIDDAIARLEGRDDWGNLWEVSHRNRVSLRVTDVRRLAPVGGGEKGEETGG